MPIVMGEKVEMTVSKGVLRIGGTIVGGTLGFLVMLRSSVASDPYLTMLFVVLFSFVFGLAGRTQYLWASLSSFMCLLMAMHNCL